MATQYTDEQKAAYKAGAAAAKKKAPAKSAAKKRAPAKSAAAPRKPKVIKKRSGCSAADSYTNRKTGEVVQRPIIRAWRLDKNFGYQTLVAFLSKNDGMPKNEANGDRFRNMVVTLTSKAGKSTVNGVYDDKYKKLKLIDLGLVANPYAPRGGYFGPGGSRLKSKATK